jgi:hypothetical protein
MQRFYDEKLYFAQLTHEVNRGAKKVEHIQERTAKPQISPLRIALAFRDNQGDVVMLLLSAEPLDVGNDRGDNGLRGLFAVPPQAFGQTLFSEFFLRVVAGFGDPICVEREDVAGLELAFYRRTGPVFEQSQNRASRVKPFHRVIPAE